ncbi:NUDIX hydrolase [Anaerocolumna sp. MB42-C2]|uniref:NUDIX hydrolase n=1 Tax=Anaerocolumna sp. MB42-C2 TaxID=3070997 RepID=UPI0027DFC699|nr:NUDIX domain-containing protein [Anaerocolumna sp. MB42-C2]WMJ87421.1 NUDIX domain-containing protein [Anaerocolumna sp. MB42-C2]
MINNHFTATGIVFNSKKEILMIHHNKLHVWLPPGGHVDDNELPDDAVLREIFEETGIRAEIINNKRSLPLTDCKELEIPFVILLEDMEGDGTHNHIDMIYLCKAINEDYVPQEIEVNGIGWFSFEQIKELKTFDNVIKTISQAVEFIKED